MLINGHMWYQRLLRCSVLPKCWNFFLSFHTLVSFAVSTSRTTGEVKSAVSSRAPITCWAWKLGYLLAAHLRDVLGKPKDLFSTCECDTIFFSPTFPELTHGSFEVVNLHTFHGPENLSHVGRKLGQKKCQRRG